MYILYFIIYFKGAVSRVFVILDRPVSIGKPPSPPPYQHPSALGNPPYKKKLLTSYGNAPVNVLLNVLLNVQLNVLQMYFS